MVSSVLQTRDSSPVTMQGADKLTGRRAPYLWRKKIDMYMYSTKCMQIITMWRLRIDIKYHSAMHFNAQSAELPLREG